MGGSSHVDLNLRVQVWLETVPLLLAKANVKHVSLFCHSAGAIYLLNTLLRYRDILDPRAPTAVLIAPWVDATKSKSLHGTILSYFPAGMIRAQHSIAKMLSVLSPALQASGAVSSALIEAAVPASAQGDTDLSLEAERYGCDTATAKEVAKTVFQYIWQEETKAINEEALTCLRKSGTSWEAAADYAVLVRKLAEQEDKLQPRALQKLSVRAYFAASDDLVGKGGQKYVDACFAQPGIADMIDFESSVKPGTGHNSIIVDHKVGPIVEVFNHVGSILKK